MGRKFRTIEPQPKCIGSYEKRVYYLKPLQINVSIIHFKWCLWELSSLTNCEHNKHQVNPESPLLNQFPSLFSHSIYVIFIFSKFSVCFSSFSFLIIFTFWCSMNMKWMKNVFQIENGDLLILEWWNIRMPNLRGKLHENFHHTSIFKIVNDFSIFTDFPRFFSHIFFWLSIFYRYFRIFFSNFIRQLYDFFSLWSRNTHSLIYFTIRTTY